MYNLCEKTGALASYKDDELFCAVHQADECIQTYVKADDEYWKSMDARRDYRTVNEYSLRQLREAEREIRRAIKAISQPRESIMGTRPPIISEEDE